MVVQGIYELKPLIDKSSVPDKFMNNDMIYG